MHITSIRWYTGSRSMHQLLITDLHIALAFSFRKRWIAFCIWARRRLWTHQPSDPSPSFRSPCILIVAFLIVWILRGFHTFPSFILLRLSLLRFYQRSAPVNYFLCLAWWSNLEIHWPWALVWSEGVQHDGRQIFSNASLLKRLLVVESSSQKWYLMDSKSCLFIGTALRSCVNFWDPAVLLTAVVCSTGKWLFADLFKAPSSTPVHCSPGDHFIIVLFETWKQLQ